MKLFILFLTLLSSLIFAQTDSIKIDAVKTNVVDSVKNQNHIDEVTITQFSVNKLSSPISTDVYK